MSPPMPKMITDAIYLTSRAWENVRFLATGHVLGNIIEGYNENSLPKYKGLGVKHVSKLFG